MLDERILKYIKKNKLLSWAMQDEEGVYIANAFYAFDESSLSFIIASHTYTKHIKLAFANPNIALNIAKLDKIAFLKGLQIKALFAVATKEQENIYYKRFAFARFSDANIFSLKIKYLKFSDNALNKKIELTF
ncbi:hypothetical protein [uncultured Campylobacter sp.]|uniref:hypothetical protein n=1 Tax=uncultured Campylobacter sp. TaxID=218934 RepID=UPI002632635E|nr:hypothetical protein [uncultured Campylobacter sp.]